MVHPAMDGGTNGTGSIRRFSLVALRRLGGRDEVGHEQAGVDADCDGFEEMQYCRPIGRGRQYSTILSESGLSSNQAYQ
jgi:hypothetical protein